MSNLTVPYRDGETPWSFTSRLAARNGRNAREFCLDWGARFPAVVRGERDAIGAVAAFAGISPSLLTAHSFNQQGRQSFEYRGEQFDRASLRHGRLFICPACLADDIRAAPRLASQIATHHRAPWMIDAIKTCAIHDLPLVQIAKGTEAPQCYDFAVCTAREITSLNRLKASATRRRPSRLESYIIGRLEGARQSTFLDSMKLYAAIKTCGVIGAIELFGREVGLSDLGDDEWHRAGDQGFGIAAAGPDPITKFLDELHACANLGRSGQEGPAAGYGRLYLFLRNRGKDPAFDPIRDIVGQHIRSHLALSAGSLVFGKPVEKRILHSIRSLSLEADLHPKRLRRVLRAAGIIGEHQGALSDHHVVFAAEEASRLVAQAKDAMSLPEVGEYLNAPRVHATLLAKNKFIKPHVVAGSAGARDRFAVADLDAFLGRLLDGSIGTSRLRPYHCNIPTAAKSACCSAAQIVRLALDKKLKWTGRLLGTEGYLSLLVDVREIKLHVRGPEHGGVSLRQVASMLETNDVVVRNLIVTGTLETFMATNPVNRCPQVVVGPAEIARFRETYVSLFQLSRERGKHIKAVRNELNAAGVKPALAPMKMKATFYLRAEIAKSAALHR